MLDGRDLQPGTKLSCDAVVIGSGAGGAATAWSLARDGWDVLIVEEGGEFPTAGHPRKFWEATRTMYRDAGGTVALGTPSIPLPLGKTWGGTTTINSGTCLRIADATLNRWQQDKLLDISPVEMEPYYALAEQIQGVEPVPEALQGAGNLLFAEGARKLGYSGRPLPRNARGCKGSGLCAFGCPTGAKQSVNQTFLPGALQAGARALVHSRVDEILFLRGRASGVKAVAVNRDTGKPIRIEITSRVVILAAGAIHSPDLLLRNQLSNSSGQVGRNLRIHPAAKILGIFDHDIYGWTGVPQGWLVDEFAEEGITFEGAFVPPAGLAMALPAIGADLQTMMLDYNRIAGFGVMVSDQGSGVVRPGPKGRPLITYKLHKEDIERFKRGVAIGARIYFAAGAKKILSPVLGQAVLSDEDDVRTLEQSAIKGKDLELIAFHPMGTCRAGLSSYKSVVNRWGQSWDLPGLFLTDASVFPASLGVNPQLSIMAFALRAAAFMEDNRYQFWR